MLNETKWKGQTHIQTFCSYYQTPIYGLTESETFHCLNLAAAELFKAQIKLDKVAKWEWNERLSEYCSKEHG